jgi:hypothetical protein
MSKSEFNWEIIDDNGVIESGSQENVVNIWVQMIRGEYDFSEMVPPRRGDIKLIQVWGVI